MNRRLTKEKLFDLMEKLRREIPEMVYRTSIIVGFPGETEEEFQELKQDLDTLNLDFVGVFRYSKEEGTKAAEMDGQIHPNVKRRRAKELTTLLQEKSLRRNEKFVGQRYTAIVEGVSSESEFFLQARLPSQAQEIDGHILLNDLDPISSAGQTLSPGDLIEVEITEALPLDLVGRANKIISPAKKFSNSLPQSNQPTDLAQQQLPGVRYGT